MARIAILGRGRAGGALARSLKAAGDDVVLHARRVDDLLRRAPTQIDLLLLCVRDDGIGDVAAAIARAIITDKFAPPKLIAHVAGGLGVGALAGLKQYTDVGVFHPLAALQATRAVPLGVVFGVAASSDRGGAALKRLAKRLGGTPVVVADAARVPYHAAAVVAGNMSLALIARGVKLLAAAGVDDKAAAKALAALALSQLTSVADTGNLAAALTGPFARGDDAAIARHLKWLDAHQPSTAAVYRALGADLGDLKKMPPTPNRR